MVLAAEEALSCPIRLFIFLECSWCAKLRVLETVLPPGTTIDEEGEAAAELICFDEPLGVMVEVVVAAVFVVPPVVRAWPDWPSTGFLERWRPLFICLSQYF